jgi:hypothetical protein
LGLIRRKQAQHEQDRLAVNYNKMPKDVTLLSKDEATLRKELGLCIESGEENIVRLNGEVARLRREHYNNITAIDKVLKTQGE